MRGIYQEDIFIQSSKALELSKALSTFIRAYFWEAHVAFEKDQPYFPSYPKIHMLQHLAHMMAREARLASHAFNPAATSCSLDEDFIGRIAALTRTISPRLIPLRTIQRYLCQIQLAWFDRDWPASALPRGTDGVNGKGEMAGCLPGLCGQDGRVPGGDWLDIHFFLLLPLEFVWLKLCPPKVFGY